MSIFWVVQHSELRLIVHQDDCYVFERDRYERPGNPIFFGPYTTYNEALAKVKSVGLRKGRQHNCRYCCPQYAPRQWDAEQNQHSAG